MSSFDILNWGISLLHTNFHKTYCQESRFVESDRSIDCLSLQSLDIPMLNAFHSCMTKLLAIWLNSLFPESITRTVSDKSLYIYTYVKEDS